MSRDASIEVRYFASLVETVGCSTERVEIDPATDVKALWQILVRLHPDLAGIGFRPLIACDREYATWDSGLRGVQEVAFLPPVSGG